MNTYKDRSEKTDGQALQTFRPNLARTHSGQVIHNFYWLTKKRCSYSSNRIPYLQFLSVHFRVICGRFPICREERPS